MYQDRELESPIGNHRISKRLLNAVESAYSCRPFHALRVRRWLVLGLTPQALRLRLLRRLEILPGKLRSCRFVTEGAQRLQNYEPLTNNATALTSLRE